MMEFFQKSNYQLSLPKHPTMDMLIEKSLQKTLTNDDFQELSKLINEDIYKLEDYTEGIKSVMSNLAKYDLDLSIFQEYHELWGYKLFDDIHLKLTLYAPGGEYNPYTSEIIMLTTPEGMFRRGSNPMDTIIHEIVHMGIEEAIIQKYNIPHQAKEQIVDLFVQQHFQEILPNYTQQNFGDNQIEKYLQNREDWLHLPQRINEFKKIINQKDLKYHLTPNFYFLTINHCSIVLTKFYQITFLE